MKTRLVNTARWQNDGFVNLSETAQRLVEYLISNRTIGLIPVYKISDREICFDLSCKDKKLTSDKLPTLREELKTVGIFHYKDYYIFQNDFAQYDYTGGRTDTAKQKEVNELPNELQQFLNGSLSIEQLLGNDWATIAPINHKSEIINHKSETIKREEVKKYPTPQSITDEDMRELAHKLSVSLKDVRKKHDELVDAVEANPKKYKYENYLAALRNWVKRAIEDGKIKEVKIYALPGDPDQMAIEALKGGNQ